MLRHIVRRYQAKNRAEEGQTLVEFALTLMTFLFVLVMIIEVGRILWTYVTLQHAARVGARYAVTGQWIEQYAVDLTAGYDDTSDDPLLHIAPCWPRFPGDLAPIPDYLNGPKYYEPYRSPRTCSIEATALNAMRLLPLDPHASLSDPGYYAVVVSGVTDDMYPTTGTFDRINSAGTAETLNYSSFYSDPALYDGDQWGLSRGFAGKPQQKVVVQVVHRLPIITPLLNAIADSVRLTATAVMTNEAYGGTGVQREAILPPEMPDVEALPAVTRVDLIVTNITPNFDPAAVDLAEPLSFGVTIKDDGDLNSPLDGAFDLVLYSKRDTPLSSLTTPFDVGALGLTEIGRTTVTPPPGTSAVLSQQSITVQVTNASFNLPGNYYVYAWVDAKPSTGDIDETGSGSTPDPAGEQNNAAQMVAGIVNVSAEATLTLNKVVDDPYPGVDEDVTYTVTVKNESPSNSASSVQLYDVLPAGLTLQSATPSDPSDTYDSGSGLWVIGDIPANSTAQLQIVATVDSGMLGATIVNTADQVTMGGLNMGLSDTAEIIVGATDVAITKTVDDPFPDQGTVVTYTVEAVNNGPNDATNVRVDDVLPAGLINSSSSGDGSYDGSVWDIGTLASGATATLTVQAEVDAGPSTAVTNTATLPASGLDQIDLDPSNNSDAATVAVSGHDLRVSLQLGPSGPIENNEFTYTVNVANADLVGASAVDDVVVTAAIPSGMTYVSHTAEAGTTYNPSTGKWTLPGTMAASGALHSLQITVMVDAPASTTIVLTASVPTDGDIAPANNTATSTLVVALANADLAISKTLVTPPAYQPGDDIVYRISVSNVGPQNATDLQIRDVLPDGLTNIPSTVTDSRGGVWTRSTGIWDIGTLTPTSGTITLDIPVTIADETVGQTITNTISVEMNENDPVTSNNDLEESLIVTSLIDLTLDKTLVSTGPVLPGSELSYEVTVANDSLTAATGVQVRDAIPASLTFVSASATLGSYNEANSMWNVGALEPGASATLTLNARVSTSAASGSTITNTAEVYAANQTDRDSTPNNGLVTEDDQSSVPVVVGRFFVNLGPASTCGDLVWGSDIDKSRLGGLPYTLGSQNVTWVLNQPYSGATGWGTTGGNFSKTTATIYYPGGGKIADTSSTNNLFRCQVTGAFQYQIDGLAAGQYRVYLAFADPEYDATEEVCVRYRWNGSCREWESRPSRAFDIRYNAGSSTLTAFDEYNISGEAGGRGVLNVETFTFTTGGSQPFTLYFENGSSGQSSTTPLVQGIGVEYVGP